MNKKPYILLIVCAGVIVVGMLFGSVSKPEPLPVVLTTSPVNHATHNPFLPVIITFDRAPKENEIAAIFDPDVAIRLTIEGNTIKITPATSFAPETTYTVHINTSPEYTFTFTTETDVENYPNYNESMKTFLQQYKQEYGIQDAALADIRKNSPVTGDGFVITYSYKNNTYTVALKSPADQSKLHFQSYLKQKGITKTDTLRINYINQ